MKFCEGSLSQCSWLGDLAPSFSPKKIQLSEIPKPWAVCHPSIVNVDGELMASCRMLNYELKERHISLSADKRFRSCVLLIKIDPNDLSSVTMLGRVRTHLPMRSREVLGLEDMRLYFWRGKLRGVANCRQFNEYAIAEIVRGTFDGLDFEVDQRFVWPGPHGAEKNWIPYGDGSFVYLCDPTVVLSPTGQVLSTKKALVAGDTYRGGSQLIPFNGCHLAVVHQSYKRDPGPWIYRHRFALFRDNGGLQLASCSASFYIQNVPSEYVIGLAWHPDGEHLVMGYGIWDREPWAATISVSDIAEMF